MYNGTSEHADNGIAVTVAMCTYLIELKFVLQTPNTIRRSSYVHSIILVTPSTHNYKEYNYK